MINYELLTLSELEERVEKSKGEYFWEQVSIKKERDRLRTISEIECKLIEWGYTNFKIHEDFTGAPIITITVKSFKKFKDLHLEYIKENKIIIIELVLVRKMPILGIELERHII